MRQTLFIIGLCFCSHLLFAQGILVPENQNATFFGLNSVFNRGGNNSYALGINLNRVIHGRTELGVNVNTGPQGRRVSSGIGFGAGLEYFVYKDYTAFMEFSVSSSIQYLSGNNSSTISNVGGTFYINITGKEHKKAGNLIFDFSRAWADSNRGGNRFVYTVGALININALEKPFPLIVFYSWDNSRNFFSRTRAIGVSFSKML